MNDDLERGFVREAEAFREALSRQADAFSPEPLPVPVRRRPVALLAAAAAVLLVGLVGATASIFALGGGDRHSSVATSGDAVQPQVLAGSEDAAGGASQTAATPALPDPGPGKRWAVREDIAFLVPAGWQDAAPPTHPDCIHRRGDRWDDAPRTPYVATEAGRAVSDIACPPTASGAPAEFGRLPFAMWQPYVRIDRTVQPVGSSTYRGWTLLHLPYHHRTVTILTGPHDGTAGYDVKASLRLTPADSHGCAAASPLPAGAPIQPTRKPASSPLTGTATKVTICRYSPARGALTGSRTLTGSGARDLVSAIDKAPTGSGPNAPQNCAKDLQPDSYVLLRIAGRHPGDVYVSYDLCDRHGFYDGRTVHQLTAGACRPIFARPPVTLTAAQDDVMSLCASGD